MHRLPNFHLSPCLCSVSKSFHLLRHQEHFIQHISCAWYWMDSQKFHLLWCNKWVVVVLRSPIHANEPSEYNGMLYRTSNRVLNNGIKVIILICMDGTSQYHHHQGIHNYYALHRLSVQIDVPSSGSFFVKHSVCLYKFGLVFFFRMFSITY